MSSSLLSSVIRRHLLAPSCCNYSVLLFRFFTLCHVVLFVLLFILLFCVVVLVVVLAYSRLCYHGVLLYSFLCVVLLVLVVALVVSCVPSTSSSLSSSIIHHHLLAPSCCNHSVLWFRLFRIVSHCVVSIVVRIVVLRSCSCCCPGIQLSLLSWCIVVFFSLCCSSCSCCCSCCRLCAINIFFFLVIRHSSSSTCLFFLQSQCIVVLFVSHCVILCRIVLQNYV